MSLVSFEKRFDSVESHERYLKRLYFGERLSDRLVFASITYKPTSLYMYGGAE